MNELREQIEAAMAGEEEAPEEVVETVEPEEVVEAVEETAEEKTARLRDEKGRFAKPEEEAPIDDVVEAVETKEEKPVDEVVDAVAPAPPNGWTAEAKSKWHELPEEVQAAVLQREQDAHKQISKHDEERNFGREMSKTVQPYLAQIQAEGGTPVAAVQELLNTAYLLRTGSPEQKRQLLLTTAQQFGVDLAQGDAPEGNEYSALQNRINQLESHIQNIGRQDEERFKTEVQQEVDSFASDPSHPHYETVKADMAALLANGAAKDLKDAYDKACWASSDVRATLLAQQRAEEEQKRKAEAKAKVEAAKKAGISLNGGPGSTGAAPVDRDLRSELEANFAASSGAV